jgi:hypothetical protein
MPFVTQTSVRGNALNNSMLFTAVRGGNTSVLKTVAYAQAGEDGRLYGTIASAQAANLGDTVSYLITAGYYIPGDGGAALYVRIDFQPRWSGGQIRSADGVWFALAEAEPDVKMFGAKGDGVTDDTAAIQNCIDYVIYQSASRGKVKVSPGKYVTSDTIHLGYGDTFSSVVLEGDTYKYSESSSFAGAAIIPTFSDRPCVNVQGGRGTTIRGISFIGRNRAWISGKHLGEVSADIPDLSPQAWIDPSLHPNAASRYAPYTAIAIDAYSGLKPYTAYPDVKYPAYLKINAQYNKNYSSNTLIENCEIEGFVVGIAIQPCDADGNGDYTKVRRTPINYCQYGVSIGNGQSRLVHIMDSVIAQIHTGIVTTVHGRQIGKPSILVTSSEIGACIRWINMPNLSYGVGPHFVDCYGEKIYSLGIVATNAVGQQPIVFTNCEFSFYSQRSRGAPVWILEVDGPTQVRFETSVFYGATGRYTFGPALARHFSFVNCVVDTRTATEQFEKFALNATSGITFGQLTTDPTEFSVSPMVVWNLDTGGQLQQTVITKRNCGVRTKGLCSYSTKAVAASSVNDPGADVALACDRRISKADLSFTVSGRDVTCDVGLQSWEFAQYGFDVGDIVYDDNSHVTYYVRSRTGSVIKMRAQVGFDGSGTLLQAMTNDGVLHSLNSKFYTPAYVLYGSTTAGSDLLKSAARDDGIGDIWIDSNIAVGDWFFVCPDIDSFASPSSARIKNRSGTTNVIGIEGKFNRSDVRKRFTVFIRAPAPNG